MLLSGSCGRGLTADDAVDFSDQLAGLEKKLRHVGASLLLRPGLTFLLTDGRECGGRKLTAEVSLDVVELA